MHASLKPAGPGRLFRLFRPGYTSVASRMLAQLGLEENKELSWGGTCPETEIQEIQLELGGTDDRIWWETQLQDEQVTEGRRLVYSDGSMLEDGKVGGGWYGKGWMGCIPQGHSHVGDIATVWDGEIAGMAGAVEGFERGEKILLLADSKAAISAVRKAGRTGKARTRDLAKLMNIIREREEENGKGAVALGWVKSHIGIHGNEMADGMAKKGAEKGADTLQVTEGGIRQKTKRGRKKERQVVGFGKGKAVSWNQRQTTTYSQLRTNKGALQSWKYKIGKAEDPGCRHCREGRAETGDHIMFECRKWESLRREVWIEEEYTARSWRCWEDLDSGNWTIKEKDAEGEWTTRDLVAEFMSKVKLRS